MSFWIGILVSCAVFLLAGIGAAQVQRMLGLISVAHGLVLGSGAYAYAVAGGMGWPPLIALLAALLTGAALGNLLLFAGDRAIGEDYALATFALQIVWGATVLNTRPMLGGTLGISGISLLPAPSMVSDALATLVWCAGLLALQVGLLVWGRRTALPEVCATMARSRELAATLALPTGRVRALLGVLYGCSLGGAGAVWAGYLSFIEPGLFGTRMSVVVLATAFAGAVWPIWGTLAGVVLLVGLPPVLRLVDLPSPRVGSLQGFLAGMAVFVTASTVFKHRLVAHGEEQ